MTKSFIETLPSRSVKYTDRRTFHSGGPGNPELELRRVSKPNEVSPISH